jgi:hypothetical protein
MNRDMPHLPFVPTFICIMLSACLIAACFEWTVDTFDAPPLRMWYTIPRRESHHASCGQCPLGEVNNARYSATLEQPGNAVQP